MIHLRAYKSVKAGALPGELLPPSAPLRRSVGYYGENKSDSIAHAAKNK